MCLDLNLHSLKTSWKGVKRGNKTFQIGKRSILCFSGHQILKVTYSK